MFTPPPAAPVKFTPLHQATRNPVVEAGGPIELRCKVSEPSAQVYWHKDGDLLLPHREFKIQTHEGLRALQILSTQVRHSGLYSCAAAEDNIDFKVDVTGDISESVSLTVFFLRKIKERQS